MKRSNRLWVYDLNVDSVYLACTSLELQSIPNFGLIFRGCKKMDISKFPLHSLLTSSKDVPCSTVSVFPIIIIFVPHLGECKLVGVERIICSPELTLDSANKSVSKKANSL